jgi:sugar lactone lactonase YvrE
MVEVAVASGDQLGEGAYFDHEAGCLWWVDIPMPSALHRLDIATGAHQRFVMPQMISAVRAWRGRNELLVACHSGLGMIRRDGSNFNHLLDPEPQRPFNRSNDSGTDSQGRFWFGTMQNNMAPDGSALEIRLSSGALYRVNQDLTVTKHQDNVAVPNSISWSPDGRKFYFCDTMERTIFAHDYDADTGTITGRRPFARFHRGVPDGSCVDADGCLWNARWGGGCVVRFTPDGAVDRVIDVPVARVTSCAFGGPGFETLFITTAWHGATAAQRAAEPLAGHLFALRPGVKGLPAPPFG